MPFSTQPRVNPPAVSSNFPTATSQRLDVPHVDHGLPELLEEGAFSGCEAVDNGDGVSPWSREQLLVTLQKPLPNLKICVVVFVEHVRCYWVEVGSCVWTCWANPFKESSVVSIQWWVWPSSVVEIRKSVAEESASRSTKRMRSWVVHQFIHDYNQFSSLHFINP